VWTLILQSEHEGPTLISCTARLLRVGFVTSEPPFRAVVAHGVMTVLGALVVIAAMLVALH
ncbi:MAG TPA: hypothetical protein VF913_16945, partial [Xanthobacteraceae bacterium]